MQSALSRVGLSITSSLLLATGCAGTSSHVAGNAALAPAPEPSGAPAPASTTSRIVYLDGPASLARLKETDPAHYPRVQQILAAADVLCAPGPATVHDAGRPSGARCEAMLLRTSYPPKRQISFTLDDTHYVALVVLTQDIPQLIPAR
jgi:hypothetical protein